MQVNNYLREVTEKCPLQLARTAPEPISRPPGSFVSPGKHRLSNAPQVKQNNELDLLKWLKKSAPVRREEPSAQNNFPGESCCQ
jgi:hypothetical protein